MAIFPALRAQPQFSKKLGYAIALRQSIDCPIWNMPVIEQVRWTISGPLIDDDVREQFGDRVDIDDFVASRLR